MVLMVEAWHDFDHQNKIIKRKTTEISPNKKGQKLTVNKLIGSHAKRPELDPQNPWGGAGHSRTHLQSQHW